MSVDISLIFFFCVIFLFSQLSRWAGRSHPVLHIAIAANWPSTVVYVFIGLALFSLLCLRTFITTLSPTHLPIHVEFKWDRNFEVCF